jgi:hypothetical protein
MTVLIHQDYAIAADSRGSRGSVTLQDLRSGTYFGQMQLRGSILVIKDNTTTASGYIAFGTSMTAIPTSPTTGTGIYIDYRGIYGNASGVPQFYLDAATGKAFAGGGDVVLNVDGISLLADATNLLNWENASGTQVAYVMAAQDSASPATDDESALEMIVEGTASYPAAKAIIKTTPVDNPTGFTRFMVYSDNTGNKGWATIGSQNGSPAIAFSGFGIQAAGAAGDEPDSLLHLKSTAPTFRMEDSTASAKSLLVTVDANKATFEEAAGTDILVMDLANARVGIGTASPSVLFEANGAAIFNESGADADFRVESDGEANMLFVDGGTNRIGIGTAAPTTTLDLNDSTFRVRTARTPASASATGTQGEICWDATYFYICVATDTWERTEHVSW